MVYLKQMEKALFDGSAGAASWLSRLALTARMVAGQQHACSNPSASRDTCSVDQLTTPT